MKRIMQKLFKRPKAEVTERSKTFLAEEEQRQIGEVRDRLQRVREELAFIDRRKAHREANT